MGVPATPAQLPRQLQDTQGCGADSGAGVPLRVQARREAWEEQVREEGVNGGVVRQPPSHRVTSLK